MRFLVAALLALLAGPSVAQQHHQHQHKHAPYAGLQTRPVKALSEQQITDLRAGRGMGLALAAELNGYPGPLHVIELADGLQLTAHQRHKVQGLYDAMKKEAIVVGEKLIRQEEALDRHFAEGKISPEALVSLTTNIGQTQGELRAVHLKYHLTTAALLTSDQMKRYGELRGYR